MVAYTGEPCVEEAETGSSLDSLASHLPRSTGYYQVSEEFYLKKQGGKMAHEFVF